jgi:hypothetical protein
MIIPKNIEHPTSNIERRRLRRAGLHFDVGCWMLDVRCFLILAAVLFDVTHCRAALTSEVRLHHGVPALFVNGKLTSQLLAAPYQSGTNDYCDFLKSGTRIFNIYFRFNWTAPEQYDFSRLDARLDSYLKLDPNALFIGRVLLTPGAWFAQQYPAATTARRPACFRGRIRRFHRSIIASCRTRR